MSLAKKLKSKNAGKGETRLPPLWKGPASPEPQGGVTQSLLSRYLCCPERFRIKVIDGLTPMDDFSPRLEYGNLWHVCEEAYAMGGNPIVDNHNGSPWERALLDYAKKLAKKYPTSANQVDHWYNVCKVQFPVYVKYWKKHPDVKNREPVLAEVPFKVPYVLPSGRVVWLRGKWDSLDIITEAKTKGLWLQENKSKGDIDPAAMIRNLTFDLQTMTYLIALDTLLSYARNGVPDALDGLDEEILPAGETFGNIPDVPLRGVRYNVIRRPLSGGKHSIRQHQPSKSNPEGESAEDFYNRLKGLIENEEVGDDGYHWFFMRWKVDILADDIEKFKRECFEPILENLLDDYEWWSYCYTAWGPDQSSVVYRYMTRGEVFPEHRRRHYRLPYGLYNPTLEGRASEVDEYLIIGSTVGLVRAETLFNELEV